jgi:hypothetical protein
VSCEKLLVCLPRRAFHLLLRLLAPPLVYKAGRPGVNRDVGYTKGLASVSCVHAEMTRCGRNLPFEIVVRNPRQPGVCRPKGRRYNVQSIDATLKIRLVPNMNRAVIEPVEIRGMGDGAAIARAVDANHRTRPDIGDFAGDEALKCAA